MTRKARDSTNLGTFRDRSYRHDHLSFSIRRDTFSQQESEPTNLEMRYTYPFLISDIGLGKH